MLMSTTDSLVCGDCGRQGSQRWGAGEITLESTIRKSQVNPTGKWQVSQWKKSPWRSLRWKKPQMSRRQWSPRQSRWRKEPGWWVRADPGGRPTEVELGEVKTQAVTNKAVQGSRQTWTEHRKQTQKQKEQKHNKTWYLIYSTYTVVLSKISLWHCGKVSEHKDTEQVQFNTSPGGWFIYNVQVKCRSL